MAASFHIDVVTDHLHRQIHIPLTFMFLVWRRIFGLPIFLAIWYINYRKAAELHDSKFPNYIITHITTSEAIPTVPQGPWIRESYLNWENRISRAAYVLLKAPRWRRGVGGPSAALCLYSLPPLQESGHSYLTVLLSFCRHCAEDVAGILPRKQR